MGTQYITRTIARGFWIAFTSVFDMIDAWNNKRQTRKDLFSLSEKELCDIGLSRGDIHRF